MRPTFHFTVAPGRVVRPPTVGAYKEAKHMVVLGLILLILGLLLPQSILVTIGIILIVVGLVLNFVPIGGSSRRVF